MDQPRRNATRGQRESDKALRVEGRWTQRPFRRHVFASEGDFSYFALLQSVHDRHRPRAQMDREHRQQFVEGGGGGGGGKKTPPPPPPSWRSVISTRRTASAAGCSATSTTRQMRSTTAYLRASRSAETWTRGAMRAHGGSRSCATAASPPRGSQSGAMSRSTPCPTTSTLLPQSDANEIEERIDAAQRRERMTQSLRELPVEFRELILRARSRNCPTARSPMCCRCR